MNNKNKTSSGGGRWIAWSIFFLVTIIVILLASVAIVRWSIGKGVTTATDTFHDAYTEAREETYQEYHDLAYAYSESNHHVSNRVLISINAIKEKADLQVLTVSDVVYIISDKADTDSGTTSWLKVSGAGVFTVNLTAAEYIVDNERQHVLVRVPNPVLDSSNISIDNFETLYFEENVWRSDNSVKSGEELARNQLSEAKQQIQEDFEANEQYSKLAKTSTESMLAALIKGVNPEAENLKVEVEFY